MHTKLCKRTLIYLNANKVATTWKSLCSCLKEIMPPKKEFLWTDDEVELLLNITHEYKTAKAAECTDWESVKSKYADILDLFKEHSPGSDDERKQLDKDYRGIGIGRATGAKAPLNFPVGGLKLTSWSGWTRWPH